MVALCEMSTLQLRNIPMENQESSNSGGHSMITLDAVMTGITMGTFMLLVFHYGITHFMGVSCL